MASFSTILSSSGTSSDASVCPVIPSPPAALTTPFVAPSDCPVTAFASGSSYSCFPPKFTSYWRICYDVMGYYSPAICPSGYTTAGTPVSTLSTMIGGATRQGDFAQMCCPSSYTYNTLDYSHCYSSTFSSALSAIGIQVRWQSSDLSLFSPTPSPHPPVPTIPSVPTVPPVPKNSLSAGAKAGIGLGAALTIIILVAILLFFCRRRFSQKHDNAHIIEADAETRLDNIHGAPEPVLVNREHGAEKHTSLSSTEPPVSHNSYLTTFPVTAVSPVNSATQTLEAHGRPSPTMGAPEAGLEVLAELPRSAATVNYAQGERESGLEVVTPQPGVGYNPEREELLGKLDRLRVQRQHLMEMRAIDAEEARLRAQLEELDATL